ncbi:Protein bric-a-brac 1 [Orchesella cincta]|uniref:Protein bric-a-brac 1 n=1 Tax=Orchesella cincta TaxID=48709 RepID=A0A1D2MP13_ORCCI|nr:Protein bric-a-brac 1 [Orchesella cincta]
MASTENTTNDFSKTGVDLFASSSENEEKTGNTTNNPRTFQVTYKHHHDTLSKGLFTDAHSDILLACDGESFKCHKVILCSVSKQFATVIGNLGSLNTSGSGQLPVIMINGMRPLILKNLIEFMYRGTVSILSENIDEFIKAGKEMKVHGLIKNMQEAPIDCSGLGQGNSLEHFLSAEIDETGGDAGLGGSGINNDGNCSSRTVTATSDISNCDEDDFKPNWRNPSPETSRHKIKPERPMVVEKAKKSKLKLKFLPTHSSTAKKASSFKEPYSRPGITRIRKTSSTYQVLQPLNIKMEGISMSEDFDDGVINSEEGQLENRGKSPVRLPNVGNDSYTGLRKIITSYFPPSDISQQDIDSQENAANNASLSVAPRKRLIPKTEPTERGKEVKKSKRSEVVIRKTKEERDEFEKLMQAAIKQVMESHNVVRSAKTHGVPASTLRGRLKKLGYCPPPKAPPKPQSE